MPNTCLLYTSNALIEKYDHAQMDAILGDTTGIQRIRGMAGSGKTIVLARKAVEIYMAHRDWTIVITYSTRALKNQLVRSISKFYADKNCLLYTAGFQKESILQKLAGI